MIISSTKNVAIFAATTGGCKMKYLTLALAFAKVIEPIYAEYQAALAEGKSSDSVQIKAEKILQDLEAAIQQALTVL